MTAYMLIHVPLPWILGYLWFRAEWYKSLESHKFIFTISSIDPIWAWAGIRTSNLLEEPYWAQSVALAFSSMNLANNSPRFANLIKINLFLKF